MRTRTTDRARSAIEPPVAGTVEAPSYPDSVSYWLEDDLGNRVSKLFASSEKPMKLAGRVLENMGSLSGWAVARRDISGTRHVVASGSDLERLAASFMPERTPSEAAHVRRFNEARRRLLGSPSRARVEGDERVY
jgi:hypothetical protein